MVACGFAWARGLGESQREKEAIKFKATLVCLRRARECGTLANRIENQAYQLTGCIPPPPRFLVPPKHARCKIMNNFGKSYLHARSHSGFQPQRSFIKYISTVLCPKGEKIGTTFSCSSSRALYLITAAKRTPPVRLQKSQMSRQRTSIIRAVGRSRHGHNTT